MALGKKGEKPPKKVKIETEEQKQKRKLKEAKEIAKWEKEKAKPKFPGYMLYFVIIITIVYIVDEVTTQMGTQMQDALTSYFSGVLGDATRATSLLSTISTVTIISSVLAFLYKPLSDKYGRRIFLLVNTLGMGVGLFVVGLSTNIPVYLIGALIIAFFTPHDMQVIYIQECCPKEKRGTYYTVIKGIATLGMLVIPFLRSIFIPNDFEKWNLVYLIPSFIAFVIVIAAFFLMRETDPFIESRLAYLHMSDEEREKAREEQEAVAQQNGVLEGFKYIFKHKSILWLALADCLLWTGMGITQNYNVIMKYGYAGLTTVEQVQALNAIEGALQAQLDSTVSLINQSLYTFAIGSAIAQFIPGFIADKFGRKHAAVFTTGLTFISFVLFWIGAYNAWSPYIVGIFSGLAVGSFWLAGDLMQFICAESVPTSIRVSVNNAFGLFFYPGLAVGIVVPMAVGLIGTDVLLPIATLITTVIGMSIGLVVLILKVKDTKGVDMTQISAKE